jgi:class 3 adenylate cyclase
MTETRKLTAILAADVAGYSRLTGADEEGTLDRLRELRRKLIDPAIERNHGRVFHTAGDSILMEFASVVDAVGCALDVQRVMVVRNADFVPEKRIEFRIGIHVGDVIVESDGNLLGDGVNVAARLENIAEPNGLCISNAAYEQVRDKLPEEFVDLGERDLKNIARPVRVYSISLNRRTKALAKEDTPAPPSRGGNTVSAARPSRAHSALSHLLIRYGLRFEDAAREQAFIDSFRSRFYFVGQTSMMFGIVAWVVFGATDLLSGAGGLASTQFRFMLALPLLLLFFAASFTKRAHRLWQRFFALFAVVGIICMYVALLLVGPQSWFRFEQATMSFMMFIALVGLVPFTTLYTLGVGAFIFALHAVYDVFYAELDPIHVMFYTLFVGGAYVIACTAAWVREGTLRSAFVS